MARYILVQIAGYVNHHANSFISIAVLFPVMLSIVSTKNPRIDDCAYVFKRSSIATLLCMQRGC